MNKNLHNIDDIFNSAHQRLQEEPSAEVWDKINAGLDKKDAEGYRKRFVGWKRIAIILIMLLSAFVLYESGIIKRGSGKRNNNAAFNKNSVFIDSSAQTDNAVNILKSEHEKDIKDSQILSNKKKTNNEVNRFEMPVTQQKIVSRKNNKKTLIISNDKNIDSNKNIMISNESVRNKINPYRKFPILNYRNKSGNDPVYDLQFTDKNNKQKLPVYDINNRLVDKKISNETFAIKKNGIIPVEKLPVIEKYTQLMMSGKSLFSFIPDSIFSKKIAKQNAKMGKVKFNPYWTVTGFTLNDWAQYKLDNDVKDNNNNVQDEKVEIGKREKHESSFSTGILVTRQFTKQLGVKTGLIYSNTAIAIDPQKIYAAKETNGNIAYKYIASSGYAFITPGFGLPPSVGDSLNASSAQHNLRSLSIPLMLTYKIEKKKFSITSSAGITANFITSAKIKTEVEDAINKQTVTINGLNGTKGFYIGFMTDLNLQYNINKQWAFNVLPTFKYAISPITKSNVVKTFPYSFGFGLGVTYKF